MSASARLTPSRSRGLQFPFPSGVAASIEAVDLVQGFTKEALLNPDLVRLPEHEVEKTWTRPRIRVAEPDLEPVLRLLHRLGIVVTFWRASPGACRMALT